MRTEEAAQPRVRLADLAPSAKQLEERAEAFRQKRATPSDRPAPASRLDEQPA